MQNAWYVFWQGAHTLEDHLEKDGIEVELKSFETDEGIQGLGQNPFVRILHAIYIFMYKNCWFVLSSFYDMF